MNLAAARAFAPNLIQGLSGPRPHWAGFDLQRPLIMGVLFGLGAGLMADAGWRIFCHFSEPAHVLSAHLGGVLVSAMAGAARKYDALEASGSTR